MQIRCRSQIIAARFESYPGNRDNLGPRRAVRRGGNSWCMQRVPYRIDTINPANRNGVARRCIGQRDVIIAAAVVDGIVLFVVPPRRIYDI